MMMAPTTITTVMAIARILKVGNRPCAATMPVTTEPSSKLPRPKPMSMMPDARPTLSGNHFVMVEITALYPIPTPPPPNTP